MKNWKINSWRKFSVKHIPEYPDKKELEQVLGKIKKFPPLVFAGEARSLKSKHAEGTKTSIGRGICLHFTPSNVPSNFAYSFIFFMSGEVPNKAVFLSCPKDV